MKPYKRRPVRFRLACGLEDGAHTHLHAHLQRLLLLAQAALLVCLVVAPQRAAAVAVWGKIEKDEMKK